MNLFLITPEQIVMYFVGALLIYLAIKKGYEPALLLPMGFGAILVNLPLSGAVDQEIDGIGKVAGIIEWLYNVGIESSEAFPIILFIGVGAMIDFTPLLTQPVFFIFGLAAQVGIFLAIAVSLALGFDLNDAFSIGTIGAADGPLPILVSQILQSKYMGPIAVAAYSYMALVPIIQPPVIKFLTSKKERCIHMQYSSKEVTKKEKIIFPIIITFISGIIAPMSIGLVGFLMFGNLLRESGVLDELSMSAQNELANLITLLLGITMSFSMRAEYFVKPETIMILAIGLLAFIGDTAGGVLFAKFANLFLKNKINPMIGAAGISAFPMASRVVQKMAAAEDRGNLILMHAAGANVAGQIGSAVMGGLVLELYKILAF